ncbi:MAG: tRNA lysidine(34) synthetase TilS [Thermodesulfobacteriota bacterium]
MSEFVNKIKNTIKKYGMLERGRNLCVAVSGGVDSMVLLHVLYCLKDELSLNLFVCHVNHNLRAAESRRDLAFVRDASQRLGLRFVSRTLKKGELTGQKGVSLQSLARDKRFRALEEVMKELQADVIALGHNSGDSVETFFMRVLKGCGLKGLCGIPPARGPFIRPLIETSREEIDCYAKKEGVRHVEDSSNKTDKYLRNSVRLKLLPFIEKQYNPSIKDTVLRTQAALQRDESFIEATAKLAYLSSVIEEGKGFVALDRETLLSLHEALVARVFLMAARSVKAKGGREEYAHTVEDFLSVVSNAKPNATIKFHEGLYARREYDKIFMSRLKPRLPRRKVEVRLKVPGRTKFGEFEFRASVMDKRPKDFSSGKRFLPFGAPDPLSERVPRSGVGRGGGSPLLQRGVRRDLQEGLMTAYFDIKSLSAPLMVRTFRHGDRIMPLGMKGHKKLKDIFVDEKVSAGKRLKTPVITAGDEIAWVVGFRQSEFFKVKTGTGKILKIEISDFGS